jgi:hypothetical protein
VLNLPPEDEARIAREAATHRPLEGFAVDAMLSETVACLRDMPHHVSNGVREACHANEEQDFGHRADK